MTYFDSMGAVEKALEKHLKTVVADLLEDEYERDKIEGYDFEIDKIKSMIWARFVYGDYSSEYFRGAFVLEDGRSYRFDAWCDTSGWHCQSHIKFEALEDKWCDYDNMSDEFGKARSR